ncbi:hypothetical protein, partial [Biostraticola tofi]
LDAVIVGMPNRHLLALEGDIFARQHIRTFDLEPLARLEVDLAVGATDGTRFLLWLRKIPSRTRYKKSPPDGVGDIGDQL